MIYVHYSNLNIPHSSFYVSFFVPGSFVVEHIWKSLPFKVSWQLPETSDYINHLTYQPPCSLYCPPPLPGWSLRRGTLTLVPSICLSVSPSVCAHYSFQTVIIESLHQFNLHLTYGKNLPRGVLWVAVHVIKVINLHDQKSSQWRWFHDDCII
jgi:hypothetical protein